MNYEATLLIVITYLLIVFLMLVILITTSPHTDKDNLKANHEVLPNETELESKINLITKQIGNVEKTLNPIVELIQNHEKILSGSQSKGALGEQFVEERLSYLPHDWYQRNVPLPGGIIEFALRAPNKRWIPIDSQWKNQDLLLKIEKAASHSQRNSLRAEVHQAVNKYALNSLKYLNQDQTLGFCIVAIPDAIFNLCVDIQPDLASRNIVLISYSLLVPYILLIFKEYMQTSQTADSLEISQILRRAIAEIELIQKYITSKVTPPLEIASRQQTQYNRQKQRIEYIYTSLNQVQEQLTTIKTAVNPVLNSDIISIPPTLQHHLNHVRDGLIEGVTKKQSEHPNDNVGK